MKALDSPILSFSYLLWRWDTDSVRCVSVPNSNTIRTITIHRTLTSNAVCAGIQHRDNPVKVPWNRGWSNVFGPGPVYLGQGGCSMAACCLHTHMNMLCPQQIWGTPKKGLNNLDPGSVILLCHPGRRVM